MDDTTILVEAVIDGTVIAKQSVYITQDEDYYCHRLPEHWKYHK